MQHLDFWCGIKIGIIMVWEKEMVYKFSLSKIYSGMNWDRFWSNSKSANIIPILIPLYILELFFLIVFIFYVSYYCHRSSLIFNFIFFHVSMSQVKSLWRTWERNILRTLMDSCTTQTSAQLETIRYSRYLLKMGGSWASINSIQSYRKLILYRYSNNMWQG